METTTQQPQLRLPVRQLVEFLLRQGSIESVGNGVDRAAEGSRIHRQLQRQRREQYGEAYQAEVPLSHPFHRSGICYHVEGRADGILTLEGEVVLEEIKTIQLPLSLLEENSYPSHWAQAAFYGYLYAVRQNLSQITLRLHYYQVEEQKLQSYARVRTREELEDFCLSLLDQYTPWARQSLDWRKLRDDSIHALPFPFSQYREGQRRMAVAVYRTIQGGARLYCQAPTGTGKTISALFPAVKAMGEGYGERIFYLTAKTLTRRSAQEAVERMAQSGLQLRCVTLTAKDKLCFLEERNCSPQHCPYADGYYDRINQALLRLLQSRRQLTRESLEQFARENTLCPFELVLDYSLWCDVIIGDYNYLFDLNVNLKRFFDSRGEHIFLIDEAHNLVDRSREMYTACLSKESVLAVRREAGKSLGKLNGSLSQLNAALLALWRRCRQQKGSAPALVQPEPFCELDIPLERFAGACAGWLEEHRDREIPPALLQLYFDVRFYLRVRDLCDHRYCSVAQARGRDLELRLLCLDPSALLDGFLRKGRAAVLFSATLSPLEYYISVLGGQQQEGKRRRTVERKRVTLPSPFPQGHLGVLVAGGISTKFRHRQQSAPQVAEMIGAFCGAKQGHYLIFFPSYQYLDLVRGELERLFPQLRLEVQSPNMGEPEREAFLERFHQPSGESLLGLCVLGGIYSEGIDLKGERLIGTVVVGVGLPQIGLERDLLQRYYDQQNQMGFEYAYQYPGMNKVTQAAGRVIRTMEDRGMVLLIDSRFCQQSYRQLFPAHWSHAQQVRSPEECKRLAQSFWDGWDRG